MLNGTTTIGNARLLMPADAAQYAHRTHTHTQRINHASLYIVAIKYSFELCDLEIGARYYSHHKCTPLVRVSFSMKRSATRRPDQIRKSIFNFRHMHRKRTRCTRRIGADRTRRARTISVRKCDVVHSGIVCECAIECCAREPV